MVPTRYIDPFDAIIHDVLYEYQRVDVLSNDRFRWNCWSRQTGKSFAKTLRRILRGIARKKNQIFLSAGDRQSGELMMKARLHCENLKIAFDYGEHEAGVFDDAVFKQRDIHLKEAGIRIIGLPANPNTARGFTGDVFLDEFAMHQHDREIWGAMFPSIMRGEGELDVASTPKGKQNMFYELKGNDAYGRQVVTIEDAVRQGNEANIPELRAALNDDMLWRQEFMCEFVDEATAFLTYELIASCEDEDLAYELDLDELAAHKGDVVVGVDIGRYRDLTVIWAFAASGRELRSLGLIELQSTSFREQFEVLDQVLRCKCVRKCCIDASGLGMQLAEQAEEKFGRYRVEGHQFTANLKEEMAGKLRVKAEGGNLRIPAAKPLRDDLHSIEKSVTLDGHIRLRATRQAGSHADRFWAGALAVYGASDDVGPVEAIFGPDRCIAKGAAW